MICRQCLTRASVLARRRTSSRTPFSSLAPLRASDAAAAAAQQPKFSNPVDVQQQPTAAATPPAPEVRSSCPKGTVLSGLNYFKGKQDPVAMADDEYPEWLWGCLELPPKPQAVADAATDEFSKSKKQRRIAAKQQRQIEAKMVAEGNVDALAPKIPLHEQTINLPGGEEGGLENVLEAEAKRRELKKAMRAARKLKIKENNFLRSM